MANKPKDAPATVTNVYHLYGTSSRVNVNSTDNSSNVVNVTPEQLFIQLAERIAGGTPDPVRSNAIAALNDIKQADSAPSLADRYLKFMSVLSDDITVVVPFLPALTEWVNHTAKLL